MTAVAAAILGALAAGFFQTLMRIVELRRRREAILVAIASEVDAICRLIRHQRYQEEIGEVVDAFQNNAWDGRSIIVDIRSDYFSVFNALSPELGELKPDHARDVVRFYSYCKSAIDSMRPDGPFGNGDGSPEERIGNIISTTQLLSAILELGDKIVQHPKR